MRYILNIVQGKSHFTSDEKEYIEQMITAFLDFQGTKFSGVVLEEADDDT